MTQRLVLLLAFALTCPAWAQNCNSACDKACGPVQDVGKKMYQKCVGQCLPKCYKCNPLVGTVFPKFYVLGLVYAPPGCTGRASQACATQSSVDYQAGSSMGTKVSTELVPGRPEL